MGYARAVVRLPFHGADRDKCAGEEVRLGGVVAAGQQQQQQMGQPNPGLSHPPPQWPVGVCGGRCIRPRPPLALRQPLQNGGNHGQRAIIGDAR